LGFLQDLLRGQRLGGRLGDAHRRAIRDDDGRDDQHQGHGQ
jgi:hypothetical protein